MKRTFIFLFSALFAALGMSAGNRLSSSVATMDGPEGYVYNKTISDNMDMEVYSPADAAGGICFGIQEARKDITPSAIATVLANALMQGGTHSAMTATGGTPVHVVTSGDGDMVLAIAGERDAPRYAVVIFRGQAAKLAPELLKTLRLK